MNVQLWYTGTYAYTYFAALNGTSCSGVRALLYDGGVYKGDVRYLHIAPYSGVFGTTWQKWNQADGYHWRDIGAVSSSQPNCTWSAPHLHQSANNAAWTPIYSNSGVNPTYTWEHRMEH